MGEETDSKRRKSKKEKKIHRDIELESDLLETDKQKKKHKKKKNDLETKLQHNETSEVESCEKNKKRKRKDKDKNDKTEEVPIKKKAKKEFNVEDSSLREDQILNEEPRTKKLKKKKQQDSDEDTSKHASSKKKKKDKGNSNSEFSLGVVDENVLNQASTNLGLPVDTVEDDNLETESKPKKKKDKAKAKTEADQAQPEKEGTRWSRCLTYLKQWSSDRVNWRFKKASQIHLLNIMYDKEQMIDEDFMIMLQYLEELKGKGRDKTKEDAEKLLKDDTTDDSHDSVKVERARQIYQLLN